VEGKCGGGGGRGDEGCMEEEVKVVEEVAEVKDM
jgi:hypothetical protein